MIESFDYEETFMSVPEGKRKGHSALWDDYRLKRLTEAVQLKRGKMLDIGCGGGAVTESLAHYFPNVKIYGCDVSKTAIKYAKKLGGGKVQYEVIKNKRFPYSDNFFDVCICLDVIEHVPDLEYFLYEVRRVLKKNGLFFLVVPCERQPFTFTWLFQKIKIGDKLNFKNWGHIHPEFTHAYVEKLVGAYEFSILRKTYSEHFLFQLAILFFYILPKELMMFFLKEKASDYLDRGIIMAKQKGEEKRDFMMLVRKLWLSLKRAIDVLTFFETDLLRHVPFGAWKIHILARKI